MIRRLQSSSWIVLVGVISAAMLACLGIHWLVTMLALIVIGGLAVVQPAPVACAVILSIPIQSEIMIPFVRGEITATQLLLFGLIPGWGMVFWKRRIWLDAVVLGFILVLAAFTVSFVAVETPSLWFQESYRWAIAGVFYLICRSVLTSWRDVRLAIWMTALGILGVSAMALLQYLDLGIEASSFVNGSIRVSGTFGTPNTLSAYLEFTIPLILAAVAAARFGDLRLPMLEQCLLITTAVVGLAVIGLTQSRGGLLGIVTALFVLWLAMPGKSKLVVFVVSVVAVGGFLATPTGQSMIDRFSIIYDEQVAISDNAGSGLTPDAGRSSVWGAARSMILDNPITGVGAGEFDESYREYVPRWIDRTPLGQAHNVWLQMGAQAGLLGVIGYAAWYAASAWGAITARRRAASPSSGWIITGVLAILAAYTVHSLVDYLNVLSLGLQLSAVTAIALNLAPEPLTRYLPESSRRPLIPYPEQRECQNSEVNPRTGWA